MTPAADSALHAAVRAGPLLRIDHGVSCHVNMDIGHTFRLQNGAGSLGWGEVIARDAADHLAQTFFREGAAQIMGSQTGLHMGQRHAVVKRSQRALKRAFCIALYHHQRIFLAPHDVFQLQAAPCAEVQQAGACTCQRHIWHHIKTCQNLLRHLVMLSGVQPLHACPTNSAQCVVHRGQFDDFRAGS